MVVAVPTVLTAILGQLVRLGPACLVPRPSVALSCLVLASWLTRLRMVAQRIGIGQVNEAVAHTGSQQARASVALVLVLALALAQSTDLRRRWADTARSKQPVARDPLRRLATRRNSRNH